MNETAKPVVLVWLHQDLRLSDHPAFTAASSSGFGVVPLYILDDETPAGWKMGGASRWWLHHSLAALDASLHGFGSRLILKRGRAEAVLEDMLKTLPVKAIYQHQHHEPWAAERQDRIAGLCRQHDVAHHVSLGSLLAQPGVVRGKTGGRLKVFTPFKRNLLNQVSPSAPLQTPQNPIPAPESWPSSLALKQLGLLPEKPDWSAGFTACWQVGELAAQQRLDNFLKTAVSSYAKGRDLPSIEGTSRLSPHLHFGEISPRQVFSAVMDACNGIPDEDASSFLSEIIWREFSYELLDQFPSMPEHPIRAEFSHFPWAEDAAMLAAWQRGRTGYPLVDAGMRQLWHEGWMHNRVRMICGSFLTKHLLLPWQAGADWFFDTLVDADLASNSAGWQWVSGCGADAAPYFRIFNPISQGAKFDAAGYVRHWLPVLAGLSDKDIFSPWAAPQGELMAAGVRLGENYPMPLVDHPTARQRALAAFASIRQT